jgi:hypothetical protein
MHTTQINRLRGYTSEQPSSTSPLVPRVGRPRPCTGISCDLTDWLLDHVSGSCSSLGLQLEDCIVPPPGRQRRQTRNGASTQCLSLRIGDASGALMTAYSVLFIPYLGSAGHARRCIHPT